MKMNSIRTQDKLCTSARVRTLVGVCVLLSVTNLVAAQEVEDTDITNAVETEMWGDPAVPANRIDVSTTNGIVTLTGETENILAKDRAQAIVESLVGVRAVVNRIKVEPTMDRTDDELSRAVESALLNDPATDSYEVDVKVKNGVVTLNGTVDSYAESELSETVAKGVKGVKDVKNSITVDYETERPDTEIKKDIAARLENDVRVDDFLIKVDVKNGRGKLSGTVGSLQEKNRAVADAWVAGVRSVDDTKLDIQWWARDEMRRRKAYATRTDEEIEQAVEDALLYDPRVNSFNPSVGVSAGTVTLSGVVEDLRAKRAAEQDARNTLGVWRVKNNLKVRPEIPANEELENRVTTALLGDPYVDRFDVTVEAYSGWIYLSGDVNTSFEKHQAEQVAERVKGVVGVVNYIDFEHQWTWKPDWEIKADVEDQLEWSVFVDADDINVSVEDGVVTLSGTVDSWSESNDAEKNAYQGGAKDVRNLLTVTYPYYGPYGPGCYRYGDTYYGPYSGPAGPGYPYAEP